MTQIAFNCDRCKRPVQGSHTPTATGGFYTVSNPTWVWLGRKGEHFVCDECVHSMPEYKAVYGEA